MSVYDDITQMITDRLDNGFIPWHQPWFGGSDGYVSRMTGKSYSLLNTLMLICSGHGPGNFATMKGWNSLGGHVRKGEKASWITYWEVKPRLDQVDDPDAEETIDGHKARFILRRYPVFHESQVEGADPMTNDVPEFDTTPIPEIEDLFTRYVDREGIHVESVYSRDAYYSPAGDVIHLPKASQFNSEAEYAVTALHEAIHSTGIDRRLNRKAFSDGGRTYSSSRQERSIEELIAEIGAIALYHESVTDPDQACLDNSGAYAAGWATFLRDNPRAIVIAAGAAERAANYIKSGIK